MGENKNMDEISNLLENAPLATINVKKRPNLDLTESTKPNKKSKLDSILSPNSEKIIKFLSPNSKICMRKQLFKDNNIIDLHNDNKCDLNYLNQLREQEWGKIMEYVICAHGHCPSCKSKLLLIQNPNFPVVDLKCEGCPIWYQVKVSIGSSAYFSRRQKNISVGSVRYGFVLHTTICQPTDKIILGYICINLNIVKEIAKINHRKSFILIPDNTKSNGQSPYQYNDGTSYFGKHSITWNSDIVQEYEITNTFPSILSKIIKEEYDEIKINN